VSSSAPPLALPTDSAAETRRGWLLFCLFSLYLIWGSTYLAMQWALVSFPPFRMSGLRYVVAGTLLFGWLRLRGLPGPTARQWGTSAVTGVLLLTLGNGLVAYAEVSVPSGVTAVVVGSVPLWTAVCGGLFGQWPGRFERWGLGLGFCGIVLLNLGGELGGQLGPVLALLLATTSWAFASVWSRRLTLPQGLMATAAQMLCGGTVSVLLSFAVGEHMSGMPEPRALASFLYLVVFGSLVAFSAYGYLLRNARPALATSYAYVNPVVAMLLGIWLGGERPGRYAFIAMTAVLIAVVLLTRKAAVKPAAAAAAKS
jgi:drug/metabolite transporter (DMT)-like permease